MFEALFKAWEKLARWLDRHRDNLRLSGELTFEARRWEEGKRSEDFLWRGGRLERALKVQQRGSLPLGSQEQEFLGAAHASETRRRRTKNLSVLTLVLVALALPRFLKVQARAKASEAKGMLKALQIARTL